MIIYREIDGKYNGVRTEKDENYIIKRDFHNVIKVVKDGEDIFNILDEYIAKNSDDTNALKSFTKPLRVGEFYYESVTQVEIDVTNVLQAKQELINSYKQADSTVWVGKNQTLMAIFTTAANERAFITNYYYSYIRDAVKDPDSVAYGLWLADRGNGYAFQIKNEQGLPKLTTAPPHKFEPYLEVGEKTDIKVTSLADAAAASVQGGFDLIIEQL